MTHRIFRFLRSISGATAVEYGLLAAMIALLTVSVLGSTGANIRITFFDVAEGMGAKPPAPRP